MSTLSPGQWQEVSPYLDRALSLSEEERERWLQAFRLEKPGLAEIVEQLLEERRAVEGEHLLERMPIRVANGLSILDQKIGAYSLISLIGQGGMGSVWLAVRSDGRFERRVAIKFLRFAMTSGIGVERFQREGKILGQLTHPHIAELLDAGVTPNGEPYLVLEYVEGLPIDQYCDQQTLDVNSRIRLLLDVLSAVAHAHASLIVHRDIKPSNVLVRNDSQVKLLDFGIAKLLAEEANPAAAPLTVEGRGAMTPQFAAPEQVTGESITTATDVYALGVLLYLLLTGRHPAGQRLHSTADLVKAILDIEPPRPSDVTASAEAKRAAEKRAATPEKLRRQLRGDLDTIVSKALKKKPTERYASATALADDLQRYLKHEPISARPDTSTYRTMKFVRRNRVAVSAVAVIIVALALGLGAALWEAHIARRESRVATAVENFLEGIFRANSSFQEDPVKARQTTARELLDIGARNIDSELADVPDAKYNILGTLGSMYLDLGLDDQAVSIERKRVAVARTKYGNSSAELAQALVDEGNALFASHSPTQQETALLEAKRILDGRRDFHSRLRGTLCTMLAQHYQSTDLQQAVDYSRQAVEVRRQYPSDPELAESLYSEAVVLNFLGRPHEAEPLLAEAEQVSVKLEGDPSPRLSRICAFRGEVQQQLMDFAAAEESLRHAASVAQKVNGEDHVDTLETQLRLGAFLAATSRTPEGLQHIEHARDIMLRIRGDADPFYAPQVLLVYGTALADAGRLEDGLEYISKAVANRRKNRPGTRYLGQMLEQQAAVLIQLGRYAEAEHLTDEADLIAKKVNAPPTYLGAWDRAWLLVVAGRASEAESALEAFHPSAPETDAASLDSLRLLTAKAEIALARGDADTTARLAEQADRAISGLAARAYLKHVEARAALAEGRAELIRRHPNEALPLLQRSVDLRESILDPSSALLAEAQIALADCYLDLGDPNRARELADRAKKAMGSHVELGKQYTAPLHQLEERLNHRAGGNELDRPMQNNSQRTSGPLSASRSSASSPFSHDFDL
jgi:eukaryotic-like serine/threonine-protein kinase